MSLNYFEASEDVTILPLPADVLDRLEALNKKVIEELIEDVRARKIYESFHSFQERTAGWVAKSETAYYGKIFPRRPPII